MTEQAHHPKQHMGEQVWKTVCLLFCFVEEAVKFTKGHVKGNIQDIYPVKVASKQLDIVIQLFSRDYSG